jgi:oligoribonuclease
MSNGTDAKKNPSIHADSLLVWMDLEMSGLDPEHSRILEIATVITDNDLNLVSEGPNLVIHEPDTLLEQMDDWNLRHHRASGLIERVRQSSVTLEEAETKTLDFLKKYVAKNEAPLCGNSIAQDRRFLIKYMPRVQDWLYYRNIDVSTLKELVARWYPEKFSPPRKRGFHQALSDVMESISELDYYRKNFFSPPA